MNPNDFRYMLCGKQEADLKKEDFSFLKPINQQGEKKQRALLLLHGFTSSPAVYRYLLPQLKNYDALICPALPGHADSIEAFAQIKAKDWLHATSDIAQQLINTYQKVDILGLSLGALLACQLSAQFQFNHMFLLAPALKLRLNIKYYLKLLVFLKTLGFCELRGRAGNILSTKHAELSYRRLPLSTLIELFTLIDTYQWIIPNCPIDLFLGTHDQVVASEEIEQMFLSLPNTKIHWLTQSAHVLPLDNDMDQIVHCVNEASSKNPLPNLGEG
jgi:carboxylesterase